MALADDGQHRVACILRPAHRRNMQAVGGTLQRKLPQRGVRNQVEPTGTKPRTKPKCCSLHGSANVEPSGTKPRCCNLHDSANVEPSGTNLNQARNQVIFKEALYGIHILGERTVSYYNTK